MYMNKNDRIHKPKLTAFKVVVTQNDKLLADYMFDDLKAAMVFESKMRDKGYTTNTIRQNI